MAKEYIICFQKKDGTHWFSIVGGVKDIDKYIEKFIEPVVSSPETIMVFDRDIDFLI